MHKYFVPTKTYLYIVLLKYIVFCQQLDAFQNVAEL